MRLFPSVYVRVRILECETSLRVLVWVWGFLGVGGLGGWRSVCK